MGQHSVATSLTSVRLLNTVSLLISLVSTGDLFQVGIADQSSAYCCNGALDAMFIATNFEEGEAMSMEEQDENDDNALMRFEWIEILIRAAIAKFIKCKRATADVSEAVIMLCDEHMSRLPPGAETDSNQFRRDRLYNEAVDVILRVRRAYACGRTMVAVAACDISPTAP